MLRVRDNKGKVLAIPPDAAVLEICSTDGKVGRLIMLVPEGVVILDPQDPEFHDYCRVMRLEKAEHISIDASRSENRAAGALF